jgi:hypothetical protein
MAGNQVKRGLVGTAAAASAAAKALIDGLTALKAIFKRMPVLDSRLTHAPAEQDDLIVDAAGKIEQSVIQVFDLNADGDAFEPRTLHGSSWPAPI